MAATQYRDSTPISLMHPEAPMKPDLMLVLSYIVVTAVGLLMIFSATAPGLEARGLDPTRELKEQAIFVVIGFLVFGVVSSIDLTEIRGFTAPNYVTSILLLVLVFIVGDSAGGAQRWIDLGLLRFQPSEVAKIAVILSLATLLSAAEPPLKWLSVAKSLMLVALPAGLIFLQPDLGTMLVFAFVVIAMLFSAGATMRQLAFIGVATIIATVGVFQLDLIQDYQVDRLTRSWTPEPTSSPCPTTRCSLRSRSDPGACSGRVCSRGPRRTTSSCPSSRPTSSSRPWESSSVLWVRLR